MVNKIILQGRLVRDPEIKYVGADSVANAEFTVAWSEKYKEKETKCFLRCKAWRGTAELLEKYFAKGQEIVVEGRMETDQWTQDGENKNRTICNVDKVHFCGSKAINQNSGSGRPAPVDADEFMNIPQGLAEELPFS